MATVTYSLETIRPQFQANSWIDGNQLAPDVLGLSGGGYVFAYNNVDLNNGYVLLDFYSSAGASFSYSIPYTLDAATTFDSTDAVGGPSLTELSNGNVVVVWADANSSSPGIRATIFTESGDVARPEFSITGFSTDRAPQVTGLRDGGFVVTYQISGGTVLATVYDNAGNVTGSEAIVNTTNGVETEPAVAALEDGGYVVTWTYDNAGILEIRARIFEANGSPRSVDGSTSDFAVGLFGYNTQPAVAALPNGNWAVVYTDSGWANEDVGITLTILEPDGDVVNSFAQVNEPTDPANEFDADVTVLSNGFILVSWTYPYNPGVDNDIYFRIFDQKGLPLLIDGYSGVRVLDASFDDDVASAVSGMLNGQFAAAWQDSATDGSGGQISASINELTRTTTAGAGDINLSGDELRDTITGNAGNNRLDGRAGADTLIGLGGNDTLIVDNVNDIVFEASGGGNDRVGASVSYVLAAGQYIERMSTTVNAGVASINLTGNSFAQEITGNAGNNRLDGKGGADTLIGLAGNDTLIVDNAGDIVIEAANQGTDRVSASVTYVLAAGQHVERMTTTQSGATTSIHLTGNALAQEITGNNGNNWLTGAGGRDVLTGSGGNDTFDYNAVSDSGIGSSARDVIKDFTDTGGEQDRINVATIDANTATAANEAFVLDTNFSFSTGEIRQTLVNGGTDLLLEFNNDADADADMSILIDGRFTPLNNADFVF